MRMPPKVKPLATSTLLSLRALLESEVDQLLKWGETADAPSLTESVDVAAEIERRQQKLANLAEAEAVLQARAEERYELEKAEYETTLAERAAQQHQPGRKPRGRTPKPPL